MRQRGNNMKQADGDARLKNKGKYGMDSRRVWFVVETKDKLDTIGITKGKIMNHKVTNN